MKSANQLWKEYGEPQNIPFKTWIEQQVMTAKGSSWYKQGMSMNEIVKGNKENSTIVNPTTTAKETDSKKPFLIMGMNGIVVISVSVVAIALGVYFLNKSKNK